MDTSAVASCSRRQLGGLLSHRPCRTLTRATTLPSRRDRPPALRLAPARTGTGLDGPTRRRTRRHTLLPLSPLPRFNLSIIGRNPRRPAIAMDPAALPARPKRTMYHTTHPRPTYSTSACIRSAHLCNRVRITTQGGQPSRRGRRAHPRTTPSTHTYVACGVFYMAHLPPPPFALCPDRRYFFF
jgi:hypothetical protein